MQGPITKKRLLRYVSLKMEIENQCERLERMRANTELPAMREGDGSQRSIFVNDRLSSAIIRNIEQEEKIQRIIETNKTEMQYIEDSIDSMEDPMQREVLRLRYLDGEYCKLMPWQQVSECIYNDSDEKHMRAIFRLHGHALQALEKQTT